MTDRRPEHAQAQVNRRGLVVKRDGAKRRVRVQFPDEDGVAGYWYDVPGRGSSRNADYQMPDEGDEVWVATDASGEHGYVAGTRYNDADVSPEDDPDVTRQNRRDGSYQRHDPASGKYQDTAATQEYGPGGQTPSAGVGHMVHVAFGSSAGMHPIATGSPAVKVSR